MHSAGGTTSSVVLRLFARGRLEKLACNHGLVSIYKSVMQSIYFRSYLCVSRFKIISIQNHLRVTLQYASRLQSPQHERVNSYFSIHQVAHHLWFNSPCRNDCLRVLNGRLVKHLIMSRKTSTSEQGKCAGYHSGHFILKGLNRRITGVRMIYGK